MATEQTKLLFWRVETRHSEDTVLWRKSDRKSNIFHPPVLGSLVKPSVCNEAVKNNGHDQR